MEADEIAVDPDIAQRAAEIRGARMRALGDDALRWLALLPEWTDSLAVACDFPTGDDTLERVVERAGGMRLCESRRDRDANGRQVLRFWMPEPTRSSLIAQWQQEDGPSTRAAAAVIAAKIIGATAAGAQAADGVHYWARLASRELTLGAVPGRCLSREVGDALDAGDTASALEWILAGEEIVKLLGAELDLAVTRARRQLTSRFRAAQDEQYLTQFVERAEPLAEVRRVLESDDEWALHFIGPSGVGKTMLLRYLTTRHAKARPVPSASLIDFDYIDPRYPLEQPARLLEELAKGLADCIEDDAQESLLEDFREAAAEATRAGLAKGHDPLHALRTDELARVIEAFAAFVAELPQPVLLILDTCEELAKLHPAGEDVPSINATFEILERVHEREPSIRVLVAGRRWLTPEASNKQRTGAMPGSVMSLKKRGYLFMYEVRGYTHAEAVQYIHDACGELAPATVDAILASSGEQGRAPSLEDNDENDGPPRYNPVDLKIFADWLRRDPDLSVETINAGNFSLYVHERIVKRLEDSAEVLAAIPAAVELQRFDGRTIEPALGGDPHTRGLALAGLIEQEWTHLEGGPGPDAIVLEVDRGLLPRLRSYFHDEPERARQLERAREILAPHLGDLLESPLEELAVDVVDSALRLLDPQDAVDGFDQLAERVVREGAWSWAEATCGRLLSEDREPESCLRPQLIATVRALYVAALAQRGTRVDLAALWQGVAAEAHWHPDLERAAILKARGMLGVVRAKAVAGVVDGNEVAIAYDIARPLLARPNAVPTLAPALVSTIEALVDLGETTGKMIPPTLVHGCIEWLDEQFESAAMRAYVLTLAGRLHATRGEWPAARLVFDRVAQLDLETGDVEVRAADWVEPSSLRHRALLELLRFSLADRGPDSQLLDRCLKATLMSTTSPDAAQLLSLTLQGLLADGSLTEPVLAAATHHEEHVRGYPLSAPSHRVAPPLFVSIADGWLALGDPERALRLLTRRERLAISRYSDEDAARAAVAGSLRIMRRFRLRDRLALVSSLSSSSDADLRTEALAAGTLIVGLQPALGRATDHDHAAWRARNLLSADGDEEALTPPPRALEDDSGQALNAALDAALDRFEARTIRWRAAGLRGPQPQANEALHLIEQRTDDDSATIQDPLREQRIRIDLRMYALLGTEPPQIAGRGHVVGRLALDEGELLALRLPDQAVCLLELAERALGETGDHQGAFIACLRAAIAEIHAELPQAARARRDAVVARYERLERIDSTLPPIQRVGSVSGLERSPMRGWLRRLDVYLGWHENGPSALEVADLHLQPEVSLVPTPGLTHTAVAPHVRARAGRYADDLVSGVLLLFAPLAALFIAIAVGNSILIGVAVGTAVAAVPLVAETLGARLSRLVLPINGFDISVAEARTRAIGGEAEAELRLLPRTRWRTVKAYLHLLRWVRRRRWTTTMPILHDPAGAVPPLAVTRTLRPRVGRGYLPIRLVVTPDLAPFAWERRFATQAIADLEVDARRWPRIWRVRPEGVFRQPPTEFSTEIAVACSPRWQPFVERLAADPVRVLDSTDPQPEEPVVRPLPACAVIALGSPAVTRGGWRLRLDDENYDPADVDAPQRVFRSPDALVREAPVVIVVGRPGGHRPSVRSGLADGLRGFANDAFLAGAHAVLTVPVLPTEACAAVVAEITKETAGWRSAPRAGELVEFTNRLRSVVYRELRTAGDGDGDGERWQRVELALDVCLFAPRE